MPAGTLDIKRKMKSIGNTKKVTKAMEMVSAAKMRKAVESVLGTRPFATNAWEVLSNVSRDDAVEHHPLFVVREVEKIAVLVISSNRGLCGGFNSLVGRECQRLVDENAGKDVSFFTFGKKCRDIMNSLGLNVVSDYEKEDITNDISDVIPVVDVLISGYIKGDFDRVLVVYTDFVSPVAQKVRRKQLIPFSLEKEEFIGEVGNNPKSEVNDKDEISEYIFEPSAKKVLDYIVPRIIETYVFQAVLESEASEHSARMLAMKNASEAATDMLFDLQLSYNQVRQAGITQEIAEISSGMAAIS